MFCKKGVFSLFLIKLQAQAQVFSWELCVISKNIFFTELNIIFVPEREAQNFVFVKHEIKFLFSQAFN